MCVILGSRKIANDITYQIGSTEKGNNRLNILQRSKVYVISDRADLLYLEDEFYSCAHQVDVSQLLTILWLRVLLYCITFI